MMKICMFTNTYLPHVGGVARSVEHFTEDLRDMGQSVLVIAPTFPGMPPREEEKGRVVRVPALQKFKGSDFSVRLPLPFTINRQLEKFRPDIIHSHHPYLMGDSALRMAIQHDLPLVFTHHTLYEYYTHYTPLDSGTMKRFAVNLCTQYANMCSRVVAPSASIESLLKDRGVKAPIKVIPTGVDLDFFAGAQSRTFRKSLGIGDDTFAVGHVGRLAPEKNLEYLSEAVALFLQRGPRSVFLVVGDGPHRDTIRKIFDDRGLSKRLIMAGRKSGQELADAYHAMDVFVFSSKTETQGMVLAEAMAAGRPVIALDASGVREVVQDDANGRLLPPDCPAADFSRALEEFADNPEKQERWSRGALHTAGFFSRDKCARKLLNLYEEVWASFVKENKWTDDQLISWENMLRGIKAQWQMISRKTSAAVSALKPEK